jgi:hypothetical protein
MRPICCPGAYAFPESEFVVFDLAAQPIEAGRRLATRIGLTNLSLSQLDLARFPVDAIDARLRHFARLALLT